MKNMTLKEIARLAEGRLSQDKFADLKVQGISTDSRTIHEGQIFTAIIGPRLDGHDFIKKAFTKGACASMVDEDHLDSLPKDKPYVVVDDTVKGYQILAKNYLKSLDAEIIGITGSNGKTTTKDIVSSILSIKFKTVKTTGNLNNYLGVPMTVLTFDEDTEIGVVEMGMGEFGDISYLSQIAPPHVAIITNIGDVHLEAMGSKENICKAKMEILETMTEDDYFIYNYDDPVLRKMVAKADIKPKVITVGQDPDSDYKIHFIRSDSASTTFSMEGIRWTVALMGHYQIYNAAMGIVVGKLYGLNNDEIRQGLSVEERTAMRTELLHAKGFDILMDAYKSNPQSLSEALDTTAWLTGYRKKIAILGDMLELGPESESFHLEMGKKIDPEVFDQVVFYGPLSRYMMLGAMENFPANRLYHFEDKMALIDLVKDLIKANCLILVKGSRALRMEELVESLMEVTAAPLPPYKEDDQEN